MKNITILQVEVTGNPHLWVFDSKNTAGMILRVFFLQMLKKMAVVKRMGGGGGGGEVRFRLLEHLSILLFKAREPRSWIGKTIYHWNRLFSSTRIRLYRKRISFDQSYFLTDHDCSTVIRFQ